MGAAPFLWRACPVSTASAAESAALRPNAPTSGETDGPVQPVPSAPQALEEVLSLAGSVEAELVSEGYAGTAARVRRLGPLLGEALDWAAEHEPERGLALAAGLWRYWATSGELLEGRQQLGWLLSLVPSPSPTRLQGLTSSSLLAALAGETVDAAVAAQEAMPLARALDDELRLAFLELIVGWGDEAQGNVRGASACLEGALERFRTAQCPWGIATTLLGLGDIARLRGEARARARYAEALGLFEALRDASGVSLSHLKLGLASLALGNTEEAGKLLRQAMQEGQGDASLVAAGLVGLCALERLAGRPEAAARLLGQSHAALDAPRATQRRVDRLLAEREEAELRRALGPRYEAEWRRGQETPER